MSPSHPHRMLLSVVAFASGLGMLAHRTPAHAAVPPPREPGERDRVFFSATTLPEAKRTVQFDKDAEYPKHLRFGTTWQEPEKCGPNALYVLLRLCDRPVAYDEVVGMVPVADGGSSLADLSRAASRTGLRHQLRKVSQAELLWLPTPFLVHEKTRGQESGRADGGHFFVVTQVKGDGKFSYIDGVTGFYQHAYANRLDRSFSGYVLVPDALAFGLPERWFWWVTCLIATTVAFLLVQWVYLSWQCRKAVRVAAAA